MTAGYLTISVDDGHPLDLKAADLLSRYDLPATFYIPVKNPERSIMDKSGIPELSSSFEIGAHTYNHRVLTGLPQNDIRRELVDGKDWLEQVTGRPVESFCYPKGKFNRRVVAEVRNAGFLGARTCMHNLNIVPSDPLL
ncbi:MAG: polysaccharide deacetylase family protein, partial [Rhodospirillales bacterium]